jgi:tetratricopeptide (TPR) repeat protein
MFLLGKDFFSLLQEKTAGGLLLDMIQTHASQMEIGAVVAILVGVMIAPPKGWAIMATSYFTVIDFIRGAAPQHDEQTAKMLSDRQHGILHAKAAPWWASRGQAPRAKHEWSEARRLGGMTEGDYIDCSSLYSATDDWDEAEAVMRESIKILGDSAELRYYLTEILEHKGLLAEAEAEYHRIFKLDPDYAPAYHAYGLILMNRSRYDEALLYFTNAIDAMNRKRGFGDPEVVRYLNERGIAHAKLGHSDEAQRDFDRAIELGTEIMQKTGKMPYGTSEAVRNRGTLHGTNIRYRE